MTVLLDPSLAAYLACPVDGGVLRQSGTQLGCACGRIFPIVDGVPVLLRDDVVQTIGIAEASLRRALDPSSADARAPELYLESLGISEAEKEGILALRSQGGAVDPVISYLVGATSGHLYKELMGRLETVPVPDLRLPDGDGRILLDIGCSWGRWSVAAAKKGYAVVGIDPSLGAVMAARRLAARLGLRVQFVVGDARYLPFRPSTFDQVFSYSVLQHLSRDHVRLALGEIHRVLAHGGESLIQMAHWFGMRSLYHQARRGFLEPSDFDVRYWTRSGLKSLFSSEIGPSKLSVDGFFGLGLQPADVDLLSPGRRLIVRSSERLRRASERLQFLAALADSLYVASRKVS